MKKYLLFSCFLLAVSVAMAVPAKKGVWKTLPLNGLPVAAQLMGDEYMHYWQTADGRQLTEQADGTFAPTDMPRLRQAAMSRRQQASSRRSRRTVRHNAIGDFMHYTGQKKGIIILVEFSNMQFLPGNDSLRYTRICNEPGYNEGLFRGSVYDYFKDQSYGQFQLTFDILGPVVMDSTYQYYGHDVGLQGDDANPGAMVAAACQMVDHLVDFNDYDWDGDGTVDQVMCIYAGQGQASGGGSSTIWPHEWTLEESDWGSTLELDGVVINTYAVANERSYNSIDGIGTICHEFSHCLGLPDMYDIEYHGYYGMKEWSLMDSGSYNGNGFCPSGFSSFEKYTCGWVHPTLLNRNQTIQGMRALSDAPEVYMVRNNGFENEYYLLENRQLKGWDAELPESGLLILHVDFDRTIWEYNLVNTIMSGNNAYGYPANDHQHCTPFHANNKNNSRGITYPYYDNDSLTNQSIPAATLYNDNKDGSRMMNKGILDIQRNTDGTMNFRYRNTPSEVNIPLSTVFFETFDNCNGRGGNDGFWSTTIASSAFIPDQEGWEVTKAYGGYQCARFGNGAQAGLATTPAFSLYDDGTETADDYGEALLSFKAAGWNTDGAMLTLSIEGDGWVKPTQVIMESFLWNKYTVRVGGSGQLRVTFSPEKRFLLDDVVVVKVAVDSTSAISQTPATMYSRPMPAGYYTLDGRLAGNRPETLPGGIYLRVTPDGHRPRKVVIR